MKRIYRTGNNINGKLLGKIDLNSVFPRFVGSKSRSCCTRITQMSYTMRMYKASLSKMTQILWCGFLRCEIQICNYHQCHKHTDVLWEPPLKSIWKISIQKLLNPFEEIPNPTSEAFTQAQAFACRSPLAKSAPNSSTAPYLQTERPLWLVQTVTNLNAIYFFIFVNHTPLFTVYGRQGFNFINLERARCKNE